MPTATVQSLGSPFPRNIGRESATCDERYAWIATETQFLAVDSAEGRLAWNVQLQCDDHLQNRLPRYARLAYQYRPRLYSRFDLLTHVTTRHDGGLIVHAMRPGTGEYAWRTEIPIPLPEPWTDPEPVTNHCETEEMRVLFPCLDELVAVALVRTTRLASVWCGDGRQFPRPAFQCQTHLYVLDPATGKVQRQGTIKGMYLGFGLLTWFDGLFFSGLDVKSIDWHTLQADTVTSLPRPVCSILRYGSQLHALWHSTNQLGLQTLDLADRRVVSKAIIRHKGIRTARLRSDGCRAAVQINESRLHVFDDAGIPTVSLQFRPYPYDLHSTERRILVACDGHGANLYAFDRKNGEEVLHQKMQSPSQFFHLKEKRAFAALQGKNIDLFDEQARHLARLKREPKTKTIALCGTNMVQLQYDNTGNFHQLLVCSLGLES